MDPPVKYRSVYLPVVRDSLPRSLDVLDFAEPSLVIGTRERSHTADQGLYFLNNSFVQDQAKAMAVRLLAMPISNSERPFSNSKRLEEAFRLAYSRPATESEISAAVAFLQNFQTPEDELLQWTSLCQAIFASAEFRYVN